MQETVMKVLTFWWVVPIVLSLVLYRLVLRAFGVIMIPEDSVGVVNKKFVLFGENKTLPGGSIIALCGEAGWQADTLAPGLHFWLWPDLSDNMNPRRARTLRIEAMIKERYAPARERLLAVLKGT